MKYLRKFAVLIIAVVLIASVAIGIGVVYAVKNVNITLYSYSYEAGSEAANNKISEFKNDILSKFRGKMISSVSEEKVASAISDGDYYYVSEFKKVYPCTLSVVIREHAETFSLENENGSFSIYDENGSLLRTAHTEEENCNKVDGLPNLVVTGAEESDIKNIARVCKAFAGKFNSLRAIADGATMTKGIKDIFTVNLKCGIRIVVYDYTVLTGEKIDAAFDKFNELSAEQKQKNAVWCLADNDTVKAEYVLI